METLIIVLVGLAVGLVLGLAAGFTLGVPWGRRGLEASAPSLERRAAEHAVVREGLERLHDQLRDLEHSRISFQSQLAQQVVDMRQTTDSLRRETHSLATALRKPQVRGRWGELHLRRAVELAGMVDRCDFEEQVPMADGTLRPDVVVRLAGGKSVVVDAKVPLDAFLDATSEVTDAEREAQLQRHARQLRTHVDGLAAKRYWRALAESPEFVVLFVPGESFLSAALEADPALLEYAAEKRVVLATPTTLIALLKTVAHGWQHDTLAERAQQIHLLGRELHDRLSTMSGHLDQMGRSLNAAVGHYNQAVGSLESRVMVSARRFGDLEVTDERLPSPRQVESEARSVPTPLQLADRRAASVVRDEDPTVAL